VTTLFLTVGLPGAGKTTRARQLAKEHSALRLMPDEWTLPLSVIRSRPGNAMRWKDGCSGWVWRR
jgi:predicted kinase